MKAVAYGIPQAPRDQIASILDSLEPLPDFVPKSGLKIALTDAEAEAQSNQADADRVSKLVAAMPPRKEAGCKLNPLVFEKDDDTNFHMDFIVATSNLRAENYGITQVVLA